eukprot:TRINITY_DN762_c2_g1_i2.p1 TRINITY_DN762_c2_g1~~TRINITY_DN762_c2_g1_i2.p1  ORF type:complete len:114 (+),score=0.77 TRINITY_DN762_c2_g1_i2:213-554(+)
MVKKPPPYSQQGVFLFFQLIFQRYYVGKAFSFQILTGTFQIIKYGKLQYVYISMYYRSMVGKFACILQNLCEFMRILKLCANYKIANFIANLLTNLLIIDVDANNEYKFNQNN